MRKIESKITALASVLVVAIFGGTNASAFSLPGITPSGAPVFTNNVRVHLAPNGMLRIMGRGNQTFSLDTGSDLIVGTGGKYTLTAMFDDQGSLMSGSVSISRPHTLLMSADLTAANLVDDPYLWGFTTNNIWCSPELLLECTMSESVYVSLSKAFTGEFGRNFMAMGVAATTVPVPTAVWLFGSALGLLAWIRRRASGRTRASS